jgi:carbonic anhydrase
MSSPRPRRKLAVLACMDARIDIFALLGIGKGDAHIIRNAGGLVTDDALRSLSASQRLLGTEEIVLVMHRGCGLEGADDEKFAELLTDSGCPHPAWRLGAFDDLEQTLREGLERLRTSAELVARDRIRGLIYDPEDETVEEIA